MNFYRFDLREIVNSFSSNYIYFTEARLFLHDSFYCHVPPPLPPCESCCKKLMAQLETSYLFEHVQGQASLHLTAMQHTLFLKCAQMSNILAQM